jgi:hypothetical protein
MDEYLPVQTVFRLLDDAVRDSEDNCGYINAGIQRGIVARDGLLFGDELA